MVIHLATNATVLEGPAMYQRAVNRIHALGGMLPVVEWTFIFLPLLFHAIIGVWISATGETNSDRYTYSGNRRYTWQRWTGMLAFVFLMVHVLHLHGWMHGDWWLRSIAAPLGMAGFRPYNAASSLGIAMSGYLWPTFYLIGVLACVYHLANGLWSAGITWGLWVSQAAQVRALKLCTAFGVLLALVGVAAWVGAITVDVSAAREVEDRMYEAGVEAGTLTPAEEKRFSTEAASATASLP